MGLKEILGIRQYTTFTKAGKAVKMYEVTFTTEKSEFEYTFDIPKDEYSAEKVKEMAGARAGEIDAAIG